MKNVPNGIVVPIQNIEMTSGTLKLRIVSHYMRLHSVSQYCIRNQFGVICGGNAMFFIRFDRMNNVDYPTSFNRTEAGAFIRHSAIRANEQVYASLEDEAMLRDAEAKR